MSRIYRYNFCEDFASDLYDFSKVHQYDDRQKFKEAWKEWSNENEDSIQKETIRLQKLGYEGNITDKMFKSAKYYFRKKSTVKKEPAKRRDYVSLDKSLLEAMDEHIDLNGETKPSDSFESFLTDYEDLVGEVVLSLQTEHDAEDSMQRIKKAYKNRYFVRIASNSNMRRHESRENA